MEVKKLKFFCDGQWLESKTDKYMDCYNPSTGEITAKAPQCTIEEVEMCINSANEAFKKWSDVPSNERVQILFRMKALLDKHMDELTEICAREHGKNWDESKGDILKVREVVEFACGITHLMKGSSIMNASRRYDTVQYLEPLGVFAGIPPWNFPGMIPMGWMAPLCIATGNTMVIKLASFTPQTSMRIMDLWVEAGLPNGVLNLITCSRNESEIFLKHPLIKGISFVGSTSVGKYIYSTAAANGKRVQALTEAKNHALVLKDCALERTVNGIINSAFGCAGERCMALPAVCVEEAIADKFVEKIVEACKKIKVGPAYDKTTKLGPVVNEGHKKFVMDWIETAIKEGAELVLDGRNVKVEGYEKGFYLGPTVFDKVTPNMSVGNKEVFGPVLFIKRVKNFEEGLRIMNDNEFANGSVIYTQSGYYAREFAKRTHGGMVGVNVGIPVPISVFGFTGHKNSFFGDLHAMSTDGVRFFTEQKTVTTHWPEEGDTEIKGSWDGMI
ncbi:CoA-acylating methylmalonate-semialdehyde dehydrogenase [Brachyspira alvinipulli]|uniref:CoA-acylating methylmalonate-semialdehyde dehydrogenase n=1 Tax=Brachyspira alvinipulli TaxID=84379 RepID=UPI000489898B|nr:CoA-acylating methylmalonate-semialdehyde dehydrogenase [Brachyspira alvinipulli]